MSCERYEIGQTGFADQLRRILRTGRRKVALQLLGGVRPSIDVTPQLAEPIFGAGNFVNTSGILIPSIRFGIGAAGPTEIGENRRTRFTFRLRSVTWSQAADARLSVVAIRNADLPVGNDIASAYGTKLADPQTLGALQVVEQYQSGTQVSAGSPGVHLIHVEDYVAANGPRTLEFPGRGILVGQDFDLLVMVDGAAIDFEWAARWNEVSQEDQLAEVENLPV